MMTVLQKIQWERKDGIQCIWWYNVELLSTIESQGQNVDIRKIKDEKKNILARNIWQE